MEVNKIMMTAVMIFGSVSVADAADAGHGKLTFSGAIIDSPCSISPDSVDQTVELGQVSNVALAANGNTGTSVPRPFQIRLENCDITTMKTVQAIFSGPVSAYDPDSLGISGTASGASIEMNDGSNNKIRLGVPTTPQPLLQGYNTLPYTAYLRGGGASATITPGEFQSIAGFTLVYP
ncbi:fimbrial protein [Winslowiella iniecta]|uniref:Fimbria A protein n=1 Tax=Winslowiella iniecta TaxID=1560201 RepID=A0A0L7SWH0_9GAMM|nr:fimbrial protein [Winslowiella iniecta]KOC87492.1 fimbria A protein [Winslowiella iniecta]KOC87498.1 fimbria A protein [Winslowiella iniecta]